MNENNKISSENKKFQANKSKNKGKDITNEIVVNFKYDDYEPVINKYQPAYKKQNGKIYYDNVDILDQNRFKFILNISEGGKKSMYSKYSTLINSNVRWDDVCTVIYFSVDICTCPICLEKKLVAPKITRCGHIFCWPCLNNYYDYWVNNKINKIIPKCPLCKEKINLAEIKSCEILYCVDYVSSLDGDKNLYYNTKEKSNTNLITFNLIMQNKKAPTLYNTHYDPELDYYKKNLNKGKEDAFNFIPIENQVEFSFSRIFITTPQLMLKRLKHIQNQLEDAMKDEQSFYGDERRLKSLTECIEIISKNKNFFENSAVLKSASEEELEDNLNCNENYSDITLNNEGTNSSTIDDEMRNEKIDLSLGNFLYFYQEQFSDIYYLHPINFEILKYEYGDEANMPTEITEKILEINMYQTTPYLKNKYPFLNHLRIGSIFFFVEIDMKKLVSNHTLKQFHNVLKDRAKIRNNIKREEEFYDNYLQTLKNNEDRKLSSELSFSSMEKVKVTELFKEDIDLDLLNRNESIESSNITCEKKESKLKLVLEDTSEKDKIERKIIEQNMQKFLFNEQEFPEFEKEEHEDDGFTIKKSKKGNSNVKQNKKKKKFADVNIEIFQEIEVKQKDIEVSNGLAASNTKPNKILNENLDKKNKTNAKENLKKNMKSAKNNKK